MAVTKKQRLKQVENWLREHVKTPFPVVVVYRDAVIVEEDGRAPEHIQALTTKQGSRLLITMSLRWPQWSTIETLLHEWAHCVDWRTERHEEGRMEHPDEWGLEYGRIYRAFYDDGGADESRRYPKE